MIKVESSRCSPLPGAGNYNGIYARNIEIYQYCNNNVIFDKGYQDCFGIWVYFILMELIAVRMFVKASNGYHKHNIYSFVDLNV